MYVCVCNAVTDRDIKSAIYEGASSFEEVSARLGVGSHCGSCAGHAQEVINETHCALQTNGQPLYYAAI